MELFSLIQGTSSFEPGLLARIQVTFGHNLMHGDREEEDGVAVVGP